MPDSTTTNKNIQADNPSPKVTDPTPAPAGLEQGVSAEQAGAAKAHHFLQALRDGAEKVMAEIEQFVPKSIIDSVANTSADGVESAVKDIESDDKADEV